MYVIKRSANRMLRYCFAAWLATAGTAAAADIYPCGYLTKGSMGSILDALERLTKHPGIVGPGSGFTVDEILQLESMKAIVVLFACPDSMLPWINSDDRQLVMRWVREFPDLMMRYNPKGKAQENKFLQYVGHHLYNMPIGSYSDREIANRLQKELEKRFTNRVRPPAAKICGSGANIVLKGLSKTIKSGTAGAGTYAAKADLTLLLGICPEESVALLQQDQELFKRWDLETPGLFSVLPENKRQVEELRLAIIQYIKNMQLPSNLRKTADQIRRKIEESKVTTID